VLRVSCPRKRPPGAGNLNLSRVQVRGQKGTFMVKRRRRRPALKITGDGAGVANHAGARLLADLADEIGLTGALSTAMAPTKQRCRGHDRGDVLADLIVAIADGAETISDLATLRDQPDLFGPVASHPTVWRTLAAVDDTVLARIKTARAQARAEAWAAGADPGFYVIDIDATLVGAHSDKEQAAPTWKRGFGFHPLLAYLDATGEALAGLLRAGNAGSGTASDHISVLGDALDQLPIDPTATEVIVRADSAGWSHGFADECRNRHVRFDIGHQLTVDIASKLVSLPKQAWSPAITADGSDWREHAEVAEITHLVQDVFDSTRAWPTGLRMIARRELPHPGAAHLHRRRWAPLPSVRHRPGIARRPANDDALRPCPWKPRPARHLHRVDVHRRSNPSRLFACGRRLSTDDSSCMYNACMPNVQIREVPEDVHNELVRRAELAGQSLQQYLSTQLAAMVATPTIDDMITRIEHRPKGRLSRADAVSAIADERARR
jgi:hypothetical protein